MPICIVEHPDTWDGKSKLPGRSEMAQSTAIAECSPGVREPSGLTNLKVDYLKPYKLPHTSKSLKGLPFLQGVCFWVLVGRLLAQLSTRSVANVDDMNCKF